MKLRLFLSSTLLLSVFPAIAAAETISNFNATVTTVTTGPTGSFSELGRPYRSGTQQTWTGAETYGGVNSSTTTSTFYYNVYTFSASLFTGAPYVEISALDTQNGTSDFVVAYAGAYNSASRGTGWLGDEGQSGNFFGVAGEARYFDVTLPVGQNLVIWVGNTAVGSGLNDPINIEVDAYADTDYDDPTPTTTTVTPEPAGFVTLGTGLLSVLGMARRRMRKA